MSAYNLEQIPAESYHEPRYIFSVPNSKKLNGEALSLSPGIKYFIRKVDETLHQALNKKSLEEKPVQSWQDPAQCSLSLKGFKSGGNIYSFILNRQFIGATSNGSDRFTFDCRFLHENGQENTLMVTRPHKDINFSASVPFKSQTLSLSVRRPRDGGWDVNGISEIDYRHFSHETNDQECYKRSTIRFEMH